MEAISWNLMVVTFWYYHEQNSSYYVDYSRCNIFLILVWKAVSVTLVGFKLTLWYKSA